MSDSNLYPKILEDIYNYIFEKLSVCIDPDIFSCDTLEDLGKLYYQKILNSVSGSTESQIKSVICTLAHKDMIFETQDDFFKNICRIMQIRSLPKTQYISIQEKFNDVFSIKYTEVLSLTSIEKAKLDAEIVSIKDSEEMIRQSGSTIKSLIYDLETDENKLYTLDLQRKELETQIEMYNWACEYLTNQLSDFCDFSDRNEVDKKLRLEALNQSKDYNPQVDILFSPFEDYISITEDTIKRPYTVFYKVKFYPLWAAAYKRYKYESAFEDNASEAKEHYKSSLSSLPTFDDIYELKQHNPSSYLTSLRSYIQTYDIVDMLEKNIDKGISLRNRKEILKKALELYINSEFELFDNIAPIQIEGLFADFLKDTTNFNRFSRPQIYPSAVLREKINVLQQSSGSLYPEAIQYFKFYFNNIIRNKIAHGSYKSIYDNSEEAEIFACETLLDLNFIVYMLSRESESEKMYRFLHEYKSRHVKFTNKDNAHFGALFNDLSGNKIISEYDRIEKYRPMQVAYWLVNPYYQKIYATVADEQELLELRQDFLSKDFWAYVVDKLENNLANNCYLSISSEMQSVVRGLFRCDISNEVKKMLGETNKLLNLINYQRPLE